MGAFSDRVFAVVRQIPRGKVATYGQIARLIGAPRSARYVGYALRANPSPGDDAADIPCHRVVGSNHRLIGYAGGLAAKQGMLALEADSCDRPSGSRIG